MSGLPDSDDLIYIENLHPDVTKSMLHNLFSFCGPVAEIDLVTNPNNNNNTMTAFIRFQNAAAYEYALMAFDDSSESPSGPTALFGEVLRVRYAHKPTKLPSWRPLCAYQYVFPQCPDAFADLSPDSVAELEEKGFWPRECDVEGFSCRDLGANYERNRGQQQNYREGESSRYEPQRTGGYRENGQQPAAYQQNQPQQTYQRKPQQNDVYNTHYSHQHRPHPEQSMQYNRNEQHQLSGQQHYNRPFLQQPTTSYSHYQQPKYHPYGEQNFRGNAGNRNQHNQYNSGNYRH